MFEKTNFTRQFYMEMIDPAQRSQVYYRVRGIGGSRTYFVNAATNVPCWTVSNEEASTVECPDGFRPPPPPPALVYCHNPKKIVREPRTFTRHLHPSGLQKSDCQSLPVFMDRQLTCYDKFYRRITYLERQITDKFPWALEDHDIQSVFNKNGKADPHFPDAFTFCSRDGFMEAFNRWRAITWTAALPCAQFLGDDPVEFPYVIAGKQEQILRDESYPFSLLSDQKLVTLVFGEDPPPPPPPKEPRRGWRRRVPEKEVKPKVKDFVKKIQPIEPIPILYDTFHEFSYAYQNWASIVKEAGSLTGPEELGKICQLERVVQEEAPQPATEEVEMEGIAKEFRWAIPVPATEDKLGPILRRMRQDVNKSKLIKKIFRAEQNRGTIVCGVDKDEFVRDFQKCGYHGASIGSQRTLRPVAWFNLYPIDERQTLKIILRRQISPVAKIYEILKKRFNRELLLSMCSAEESEGSIIEVISGLFCEQIRDFEFLRLMDCEGMDLTSKIRLSVLLHLIVETDTKCRFLTLILKSENVDILFRTVKLLMLTVDPRYYVIDANFKDPGLIEIRRYYLVSLLVDMCLRVINHSGLVTALSCMQKLSRDCPNIMEHKEMTLVREKLNALNGDDDSSKLVFLVIQLPSQMCHKLFFRNDTLKWVSSDRRLYRSFVCALMHSLALPSVTPLILSKPVLEVFLERKDPPVHLLKRMIQHLTTRLECTWFDREIFTNMFKTIVTERKTSMCELLPHLGILIEKMYGPLYVNSADEEVWNPVKATINESCLSLQNYADGDLIKSPMFYKYLLSGFVCLSGCTKGNETDQMVRRSLTAVTASTGFSKFIADAILADDINTMRSGWEIVTGIVKNCKYRDMFLRKPEVMNNIKNVFAETQPTLALYFFLQFLHTTLHIFTRDQQTASLINPLTGSLAALLAHRDSRYQERPMVSGLVDLLWRDISALDENVEIKRLIFRHLQGESLSGTNTRFRADSCR